MNHQAVAKESEELTICSREMKGKTSEKDSKPKMDSCSKLMKTRMVWT